MIERTYPINWDDFWTWVDGEWRRVRLILVNYIGGPHTVEDWKSGQLYEVFEADCRHGDKPTEPPAPTE